jgi:putative sigma-54 modulation protein
MEINVTFRHLEPNESLKNYVYEKVSRIEKYLSKVTEVSVILALEKRSNIAEVIVNVNRAQITAKETNEDNMYTAIDLVMDKIERQAKKYKDKLTSHKDQQRSARHNIFSPEDFAGMHDNSLIKSETIAIRTMSADQAVLELGESDDDFFVFKNEDTDKVNVMYRRRSGDFGLIEPENS